MGTRKEKCQNTHVACLSSATFHQHSPQNSLGEEEKGPLNNREQRTTPLERTCKWLDNQMLLPSRLALHRLTQSRKSFFQESVSPSLLLHIVTWHAAPCLEDILRKRSKAITCLSLTNICLQERDTQSIIHKQQMPLYAQSVTTHVVTTKSLGYISWSRLFSGTDGTCRNCNNSAALISGIVPPGVASGVVEAADPVATPLGHFFLPSDKGTCTL